MSYLNSDQESYVRSLNSIPLAERCWCGWYRLGECPNCKTARSCADKVAEQCPGCHNDGGPERREIVHRRGCSLEAIGE